MSFARIRPRRGTKGQWESANTVLAEGEMGIEVPTDGVGTGASKIKIGDGTTSWNDLPYAVDIDKVQGAIDELKTLSVKSYHSTFQTLNITASSHTEITFPLPSGVNEVLSITPINQDSSYVLPLILQVSNSNIVIRYKNLHTSNITPKVKLMVMYR